MHTGYKCLNIPSNHVYISRNIIFDEVVFPFADLHPTAGAHYTAKVLHLLGPTPPDETDLSMTNVSSHAFCLPGSILFPP
jgi:hypothetical protein